MKHLIVIASFSFLATPAFAQSFDRSPTDPTMPSATYDPTAPVVERQVEREAQPVNDYTDRNVEQRKGYFDAGR
jgi:hypothetical protein